MRNADRTSINPAVRSAKPPGRGPYVARNRGKFGRSPHNRWANPWGLYDVGRNAAAPGIPTVTGERLIKALEKAIVECDEDEKDQEEEGSSWEKFKKEYGIKESGGLRWEIDMEQEFPHLFTISDNRRLILCLNERGTMIQAWSYPNVEDWYDKRGKMKRVTGDVDFYRFYQQFAPALIDHAPHDEATRLWKSAWGVQESASAA